MLPDVRIELHHAGLAPIRRHLRSRHCKHRPARVPLDPRGAQTGDDQHCLLVTLASHQLHTAVVQAQGERGRVRIGIAFQPVVPIHTDDVHVAGASFHAEEGEFCDGISVAVVEMGLALHGAEEDHAAIGGPFHKREGERELFAPQAVAVDRAHDHGAVLVHDADLLPIRGPLHVAHHRLVAVVDHLLEPHPLVKHPYDDQAVLITGRQLAVVLVPVHHHDRAVVPLQRLVHGQVARRGCGLPFFVVRDRCRRL
mmetsp:Transcript_15703/g.26476  ORF Transcript_15703/g.26476 Transcript_15703/m.26476 type:complete len:254 (+) Transcript_15703:2665-3426(+)